MVGGQEPGVEEEETLSPTDSQREARVEVTEVPWPPPLPDTACTCMHGGGQGDRREDDSLLAMTLSPAYVMHIHGMYN